MCGNWKSLKSRPAFFTRPLYCSFRVVLLIIACHLGQLLSIQFFFYFFSGSHQVLPSNNSILRLWRAIFSLRLFIKTDGTLPSSEKVLVFLHRLCKFICRIFFIKSYTIFLKDWSARKLLVFGLNDTRSEKGIRWRQDEITPFFKDLFYLLAIFWRLRPKLINSFWAFLLTFTKGRDLRIWIFYLEPF